MRERWFSKRAVSLHVAVLIFVPGCAVAAWWQVTRAADGNQLSYLYMVMWPIFGLLGIYFWWLLIHTDFDSVGLKGMRNRQATEPQEEDKAAAPSVPLAPGAAATTSLPADAVDTTHHPDPRLDWDHGLDTDTEDTDPDLAAYNARLAELAKEGPSTWRRPERVVARRSSQ